MILHLITSISSHGNYTQAFKAIRQIIAAHLNQLQLYSIYILCKVAFKM